MSMCVAPKRDSDGLGALTTSAALCVILYSGGFEALTPFLCSCSLFVWFL